MALAGSLEAQVGYPPARSPYRDLEDKHELTLQFGGFRPARDPLGIAPRDGALGGLQYMYRASGGFHIGATVARIGAERTIIDPASLAGDRDAVAESWPLYALDASAAMALTGAKSWHHLVPMVSGGLGLVSDFKPRDAGGFKFGTRFAVVLGAGVRWVPGGRYQVRADITDRWYSVKYPDTYYLAPVGGTAVLSGTDEPSRWLHNPAFTLGLTYFLKRR
jgi:hypothetical protein